MNAFKVTYTDGTSYSTSANGTLEEFTAYLMQFGGVVVDENPVTGKETRRQIEKIEQIKPVVTLTCCSCGEACKGRQWWNRDTGYGLCPKCAAWIATRETAEQMHENYGEADTHYFMVQA